MKKIITLFAVIGLFAGIVVSAHELTGIEIDSEGNEVVVQIEHQHPANGMPLCKINNTCPCMGLTGSFLNACEVQYAPASTGGTLEEQIISLQLRLIDLLQQLIAFYR